MTRGSYQDEIMAEVEKPVSKRNSVRSARNNIVVPRKYHMTDKDMQNLRSKFEEEVKDDSDGIKKLAGERFFNPLRRGGIYYGSVQALYLLGCNKWHSLPDFIDKIREVTTKIIGKDGKSSWEKFNNRTPRRVGNSPVSSAKDESGRVQQNMRTLQRLGGYHPYGHKLRQVLASVDIKQNANKDTFYMLRTDYGSMGEVAPNWSTEYRKPRKKKVEVVEVPDLKVSDIPVESTVEV